MARTASLKGSFEIKSDSNTEVKRLFDLSGTITEYQNTVQKIAPSQVDAVINFGGVETAKWLYLKTDQQITVKLEDNTNVGFKVDDTLVLKGEITAIFVTTGVNETNLEVVVAS